MQNSATTTATVRAIPAGAITVDSIGDSFKKGLKEAQIRQVFTRAYAAVKTSNEFKDSLFSNEELGIETTDYEETRVAWIPCGLKHKVKDIEKALAAVPEARIYKVLSYEPILTEDQKNVLVNGLTGESFENFCEVNNLDKEEWDKECSKILLNKIAEAQIVKYGEDHEQAGEEILHNGMKQYRQTYFSLTAREDEDYRLSATADTPDLILATQEIAETVKA